MSAPSYTGGKVLGLLLFLVLSQDFQRVLAAVQGRVGVRNPNIKYGRCASAPESMGSYVATAVSCRLNARVLSIGHAPTSME